MLQIYVVFDVTDYPERRWDDNIKKNLRKIGFGGCGFDSSGLG
jgi:hypothetical protein